MRGTRFGIGVDPADGLLRQGAEGYQLTWMDAKVDDWVVTPRRGKAVEINALWYNALRLLEGWLREEQGDDAAARLVDARRPASARSFNARFWYAEGGYLYDVVDGEQGDDPACRPNQLFAISLAHPVLDRGALGAGAGRWSASACSRRWGCARWPRAIPTTRRRTTATCASRDAAYHQGTVWAWLIGPFVDAWLKAHPERPRGRPAASWTASSPTSTRPASARISEIFDAEPPFTPRGCIAQAWSVAEVLRAVISTAEPGPPEWPSPRQGGPP